MSQSMAREKQDDTPKSLDQAITETETSSPKRHRRDGIILSPQPSDDPADPLNWSMTRKFTTLCIITLAGFIGLAQTVAANSGYFVQARLYDKSAVQVSYGVRKA